LASPPATGSKPWQQVEAGRPITVTTLLRFELPMSKLVEGLDAEGVYEKLEPVLPHRRRRRT